MNSINGPTISGGNLGAYLIGKIQTETVSDNPLPCLAPSPRPILPL